MYLKIGVICVIYAAAIATTIVFNPTAPPSADEGLRENIVQTLIVFPVIIKKMNVSAYCPCVKCCGIWSDGITASGMPAKGFFVAAPPQFPFGTLLSIPGYNNGLPVPVQDRGGAIKDNKLDVFFSTHNEALEFGRQYLNVTIH